MAKIELNESLNQILKVLCISCKNVNRHKVLSSVEASGKEPMDYEEWFYWSSSYQIIECQGCGDISFRNQRSNSEEYDDDGPNIEVLLYPKRSQNTWNNRDFFNIPYNLRRIYRETIDCYNNENLTLCGAGIRALVEGVCNENNIKDGEIEIVKNGKPEKKRVDTLQGKINGLYEKGKLTKENAANLHEHRFLGNTAVHNLDAPVKEELSLAIEIIEHVLDTLYEIPKKAMQLKYKRLEK